MQPLDQERPEGYDQSERRLGIGKEVQLRADTPAGPMLVRYIEAGTR